MDYEEKTKLNDKVKVIAWVMYLLYVVLLINGIVYFGLNVGIGKIDNLFNPYTYFMLALLGIASTFHRLAMVEMTEKENIRFHCSMCGASLEVKEVKITPKHGYMYEQKCPRCSRMMEPDVKSVKKM